MSRFSLGLAEISEGNRPEGAGGSPWCAGWYSTRPAHGRGRAQRGVAYAEVGALPRSVRSVLVFDDRDEDPTRRVPNRDAAEGRFREARPRAAPSVVILQIDDRLPVGQRYGLFTDEGVAAAA